MAHVKADRVAETSESTGTGDLTLEGAEDKHVAFGSEMSDGDTATVLIVHKSEGEWEVSKCTYNSAADSLTRDTVHASSNSGSAVNFSAGVKEVKLTPSAEDVANLLTDFATQSEAEAGTEDAKLMSPLRTKQAIDALVEGGGLSGHEVFTSSGTWTKPSGVERVLVMISGGGGGGGRGDNSSFTAAFNGGSSSFGALLSADGGDMGLRNGGGTINYDNQMRSRAGAEGGFPGFGTGIGEPGQSGELVVETVDVSGESSVSVTIGSGGRGGGDPDADQGYDGANGWAVVIW